jgi:hypothetical protein
MGIFGGFLVLLFELMILGAFYWGATKILPKLPFLPDTAKDILLTILQVVLIIIGLVWSADWVLGALLGLPGTGFPSIFPLMHRGVK